MNPILPQIRLDTVTAGPWDLFLAVAAGLVLALAFQLLITNLSVALGLQIAGPFDEHDDAPSSSHHDGVGRTARRITRTLGSWALLSACVSLFLGAWLGTELMLVGNTATGILTGLLIWALFSFAMLFVETSLLNGIIHTATEGLRSVSRGIGSMFGRSESTQAASIAGDVTAAIRDELLSDRRIRNFGREVVRRLDRIEAYADPKKLRRELATLVDHTEFHARIQGAQDEPGASLVSVTADTHNGSGDRLRKTRDKAKQAAGIAKEEYESEKGPTASTADAVMRMAGVDPARAQEYRDRFEDYLRRTEADALDPESLQNDLDTLFHDPRHGWELLKERFTGSGRGTLRGLLTARGVSKKRADEILSWSESALQKLSHTKGSGDDSFSKRRAEQRVRDFLERVDDPKLRYEDLHAEFELLFDDPRAGGEALLERLRSLDRESIKSLLATQSSISEQDAERYVRNIESARDSVVEGAERMKNEIVSRAEALKQRALEAAEETRRTAATAAWWIFFISITGGVAAALGGFLGATTSMV